MLLAAYDLGDDVRIGDVRPRHADHVELALGDGVTRGGDIGDARGVEGRKSGGGAHLAGKVEMRRSTHAGDRDDAGEGRVRLDRAADDVQEIELAGRSEPPRDLDAFGLRDALFGILVGNHANAPDEIRTNGGTHRVDHPEGEAQAVVERAVEVVIAMVGQRRPEPVHQVAVGFELDAVETGGLARCAAEA